MAKNKKLIPVTSNADAELAQAAEQYHREDGTFDPSLFVGTLKDLPISDIRAVQKYRRDRGLKTGFPVVNIRTGETLIFIQAVKDQEMRCCTKDGWEQAIEKVKEIAVKDPMAVKPASTYVDRACATVVSEHDLVGEAVYLKQVSTPENEALLKQLDELATEYDMAMATVKEIDAKRQELNKQLFATFTK